MATGQVNELENIELVKSPKSPRE